MQNAYAENRTRLAFVRGEIAPITPSAPVLGLRPDGGILVEKNKSKNIAKSAKKIIIVCENISIFGANGVIRATYPTAPMSESPTPRGCKNRYG